MDCVLLLTILSLSLITLLSPLCFPCSSAPPRHVHATWWLPGVDEGDFLVRLSSSGGYALSVRTGGVVKHCKIEQVSGISFYFFFPFSMIQSASKLPR